VGIERDGIRSLNAREQSTSRFCEGGRFALRGCVLNYRTTLRDMEILLDDLRRVAKSLATFA
jgi:hypothetical protein